VLDRRSLTTDLPSSKDSPTIGLRLTGPNHIVRTGARIQLKGVHAHANRARGDRRPKKE
jgi:hypothetical protein